MITMNLTTSECERGRGLWKINNEYLNDEKYCVEIVDLIVSTFRNTEHLDGLESWEVNKNKIANYS